MAPANGNAVAPDPDDGIVGMKLTAGEFVGLGDSEDLADAGQHLELGFKLGVHVPQHADDGALYSRV